jgi:hypothetical protein
VLPNSRLLCDACESALDRASFSAPKLGTLGRMSASGAMRSARKVAGVPTGGNSVRGLIFLLLVSGCATSSETYLPDGQKGHSITCSGAAQTWGACYEKAGQICGEKGYDILAGGSERGAVVTGGQYGVFGGSTMNRNMLIRCKR